MCKAHRNRPLTEAQIKRNRFLSKTRYVVEQSFGTLHRKFRYARAAYFQHGQSGRAKPSEGDVFEPVESRQQAKRARCCLKGGLDARLSGIGGEKSGNLEQKTAGILGLGFGCWGEEEEGYLQRSQVASFEFH